MTRIALAPNSGWTLLKTSARRLRPGVPAVDKVVPSAAKPTNGRDAQDSDVIATALRDRGGSDLAGTFSSVRTARIGTGADVGLSRVPIS